MWVWCVNVCVDVFVCAGRSVKVCMCVRLLIAVISSLDPAIRLLIDHD